MSHPDEYVNRLWLVLETISATNPNMSLEDGLEAAHKVISEIAWNRVVGADVPNVGAARGTSFPSSMFTDPAALGTWLGAHSVEVCNAFRVDKKIVAIKEARAFVGCGLKEAKDAIDWLWGHPELFIAVKSPLPPF